MKIGEAAPRLDAWSKVTGRERYAADYYAPDFLWAGAKRAGVPHGRLRGIDLAAAKNLPGVFAVLTHADVPGVNRLGVVRQDQPILADAKVRHAGDAVALVLARDREVLKKALGLIRLDIEPLPGVFDAAAALAAHAPRVHEENLSGNVIREVTVTKGRGAEALNGCDVVVEFSFETPRQEHAFLETQTGWAFLDEEGTLVIAASTQTPFRDRAEIARALDLNPEKVRVIAPYLGGGFGGKDGITVQALLAVAALHAGRKPVKMWWEREESFLAGVKRVPARLEYRLGAKTDGTMEALACRFFFDGGAYASLSGEIMTLAVEHAGGAYRIPHTHIEAVCAYTNNPVGGPFRGFGVPQVTAALEQTVDLLAARLGFDPLEVRARNVLDRGDRNCIGVAMTHSVSARECLRLIEDHPLWKSRAEWKESAGQFKRRGVGIACLSHAMGYPKAVPDRAGAKIELTLDGKFRIYAGVSDMGQGNAVTYLQIAGHILNQNREHFDLILPDTAQTLPSGSSSASRTTYVYGNALIEAANVMRESILRCASQLLSAQPEDLVLAPGRALHAPAERCVPFSRIAAVLGDKRIVERCYTMPVARESADLIYLGPHVIFSYGAHLVRVEVDELTGAVEVQDYVAATDAGRYGAGVAFRPAALRGRADLPGLLHRLGALLRGSLRGRHKHEQPQVFWGSNRFHRFSQPQR